MRFLTGTALAFFFMGLNSFATVPDYLDRWQHDPLHVSQELPEKSKISGPLKFTSTELANQDFVTAKDQSRTNLCKMAGFDDCSEGFSPLAQHGDFYFLERFVGQPLETNLYALDKYQTSAVERTPWSGSYWPQYKGGIGMRYADDQFPHSDDFLTNFKYYNKNYHKEARKISRLNELAPSEKYDLLFEDKNWSLTYYSWAEPRRRYQLAGEVERWTGICHGWAAAAIVAPEPRKSFTVSLPSLGKTMEVYPDDVKALSSQIWASTRFKSAFLGGRCDVKNPAVDSKGRIIDPDCFDTNPATWHLALVNLVGKQKKSFVFDATYDYQVWNQPISSYEIRYFNPVTRKASKNVREALIPYSEFTNDNFRSYRSANTKFVIGVELALRYVVETVPAAISGVSDSSPQITSVRYYYDLEIDESLNVIGGEWYQRAHPDMIWRPLVERTLALNEPENSTWNGWLPLPQELKQLFLKAAERNQPLNAIVEQWLLQGTL